MNYKQLRNQLRREIKASPGKAAALGIGLCLGMYFWLPMLWGMLPKSKTPSTNQEMDHKTLFAKLGTSLEVTSKGTVEAPEKPWQELAAAMQSDEWMARDTKLPTNERNPFARQITEIDQQRAKKVAAELPLALVQLTPEELGLELTSTTIGPRRRMAVINDQVYREGEQIESPHGTLAIVAIRPSQVQLILGKQMFLLEIKRNLGTGRVDSSPPQSNDE